MLVNCAAAGDLLAQWKHYIKAVGDDQAARMEMARDNSIFHGQIKYDFQMMGVYSKHIAHYPGLHRQEFKVDKNAAPAVLSPCPAQ